MLRELQGHIMPICRLVWATSVDTPLAVATLSKLGGIMLKQLSDPKSIVVPLMNTYSKYVYVYFMYT